MIARLLIGVIRGYQRWISPLLGPRCRFLPTCSEYAITAVRCHGSVRGVLKAGWRLLRCQPFCRGGFDPVCSDAVHPHDFDTGACVHRRE